MEGTAERTRLMPGFADPAQEEKMWIKLEEWLSKKCPADFDFQMLTLETHYMNSIPLPSSRSDKLGFLSQAFHSNNRLNKQVAGIPYFTFSKV